MTRVLVVDDSAVVRVAMKAILEDDGLTVDVACDPVIAARKMADKRPDVIVLDLEMPRVDGMFFLRSIMSTDPLPIVICSAIADRSSSLGIRALGEGAVDIITKPKLGVRDFVQDSARAIVDAVRSAASARVHKRVFVPEPAPRWSADVVMPPPSRDRSSAKRTGADRSTGVMAGLPVSGGAASIVYTTDKVVALAASTGGTEALRLVLSAMPPDCPAIVVVQHMPESFTAAFARHLHEICAIEVREAATGDRLVPGRALIAPGNRHLLVQRSGAQYVAEVRDAPPVSRHRPSADVLFRSVAAAAGPNAIGVIMTGMGDDGAAGLLEMRQQGAFTVAQDEASCVVFGMPKGAIARGAVDRVVPLDAIAQIILQCSLADERSAYAAPQG